MAADQTLTKQRSNWVQECCFQTAVSTEGEMNFTRAEPLLLRHLAVDPTDRAWYFQELLAGVRKE